MLPKAVKAFKGLPDYLKAAEEVCGPYRWGKYCVTLMGKAFPYMAMEHPCASTCGAICLEQPCVIPHELSHSWTGNDITNGDWLQFFWNEGWTTFVEHAICEKIWGTDYANMMFIFTWKEAQADMAEYREKNPDVLKLCSNGPFFEFTRIPYAKGALFFFMLQNAIGKDTFSILIKDYMKVFNQRSMSDHCFLSFLKAWLENRMGNVDFEEFKTKHQINEWLYGTEMPSNTPIMTSKTLDAINHEVDQFLLGNSIDIEVIKTENDVYPAMMFLEALQGKVSKKQLAELDDLLHYTKSDLLSILGQWSLLCASTGHFTEETKPMISLYIINRNSMYEASKIATELAKTEEGRSLALEILQKGAKDLFPVTAEAIKACL